MPRSHETAQVAAQASDRPAATPAPRRPRAQARVDTLRAGQAFEAGLAALLIVAAATILAALPADARPLKEPPTSAREQPAFAPDGAASGTQAPGVGQVVAMTRGLVDGRRWIAVEFSGETLRLLGSPAMVEPVVSLSGGEVVAARIEPLAAPGRWRLTIEFDPREAAAIDMRASLHLHSQAVTETWTYGWNR